MNKSEKLLNKYFEELVLIEKKNSNDNHIEEMNIVENKSFYWQHAAAIIFLLISLIASFEISTNSTDGTFAHVITANEQQGYYAKTANDIYNILLISQNGE